MSVDSSSSSLMSTSTISDIDPEPELVNTLRSHKSSINTIVYSPDGQRIVSGSEDSTIIFWNLHGETPNETGHCYRLSSHKGPITSIDYAPNGKFFASASQDSTVNIWPLNAHTESLVIPNEKPITYHCHTSPIRSVNISPDSATFCTASNDKTVKIYDANHINKFLFTLHGHTNWVRSAKYSPASTGGNLIASTGDDGLILVHDIRCNPNNFPIHSISGSRNKITSLNRPPHFNCLEWYPLSDFMICVGSSDSSVRLYDTRKGQMIQFYQSHSGSVKSTSFHPTGKFLMSGSTDSMIKIYDLLEGRVLFTIQAHKNQINSVAFNSTGDSFASVGNDRTVYLWNSNLITQDAFKITPKTFVNNENVEEVYTVSSRNTIPKVSSSMTITPEPTPLPTRPSPVNRATTATAKTTDALNTTFNFASRPGARSFLSTPALNRFTNDMHCYNIPSDLNQTIPNIKSTSPFHSGALGSELKLLHLIVDQIGNLTTAVSQIEERLSVVENMVGKNHS